MTPDDLRAGIKDPRVNKYGSRVNIPDLPRVGMGDSIGGAIAAGQKYLSGAADLGKGITEAHQDILEGIMSRVPGLQELRQGVPDAISSMISGELPEQVANQIAKWGAGKGLGLGLGADSQALKHLTAQRLGVSSLGLIQQGIGAATSWLNTVTSPNMMARPVDIKSAFLPDASLFHSASVSERDDQWQVARAQAEQAASPDPYSAAMEQMRLMQAGRSQSLNMMPMASTGPVRSWQSGLSGLATRSLESGWGGVASRRNPISFSNFGAGGAGGAGANWNLGSSAATSFQQGGNPAVPPGQFNYHG